MKKILIEFFVLMKNCLRLKRPHFYKPLVGGVLVLLALTVTTVVPAEAHAPGISLVGTGTATIDGTLSPGEWDGAGHIDFTVNAPGGGTVPATLYVMNNTTYLYLAVKFAWGSLSGNWLIIHFDNDNAGGPIAIGDDVLHMGTYSGSDPSLFSDFFISNPLNWTHNPDQSSCGSRDGAGAAYTNGVYTIYEISHPLNTPDDTHDFSLSLGDKAGIALYVQIGGPPSSGGAITWFPMYLNSTTDWFGDIQISPAAPPGPPVPPSEPVTLTNNYTLTSDWRFSTLGFNIATNNITLDFNGHTITGSYPTTPTGNGVNVWSRSGITIKNGTIKGFGSGIALYESDNNVIENVIVTSSKGNGISIWNDSDGNRIEGCTITDSGVGAGDFAGIGITNASDNNTVKDTISSNNSRYGISIKGNSDGNILNGNTTNGNTLYGVVLSIGSDNNVVKNSTSNSNNTGILVSGSVGNSLTCNTTNGNTDNGILLYGGANGNLVSDSISQNNVSNGICVLNSDGNSLIGNSLTGNLKQGVVLIQGADNNLVRDNWIANNWGGIFIGPYATPPTLPLPSSNNRVYNNNFVFGASSYYLASVAVDSLGNLFNLDKPTGGNYWSDWTSPDTNYDGFVDNPKIFVGGQDNLAWVAQNGWLDKIAPVTSADISPAPNSSGWNNSNITMTLSAIDPAPGTGVAKTEFNLDDAGWTPYSAPLSITAEAIHTVKYRSVDKAGNWKAINSQDIKLDKTPPVVSIKTPIDGGAYLLNQAVNADWSIIDNLSSVDPATVVVTTQKGLPIDTGTVGTHTFSLAGADYAGNGASITVTYRVYGFSGFLPPVWANGVFKLGSTIPWKFRLTDVGGDFISNATAKIWLQKAADSGWGSLVESQSTSAATTGNLFRYDPGSNQYIFNLSTKPLSAGRWRVSIAVNGTGSASLEIILE